MFRTGLNLIIVSIACFMVDGCRKFVEIPAPTTQLVTANVFNNSASATAAVVSIYAQMVSNAESYNMEQFTGLQGDELKNYSTSSQFIQYYTNALVASTDPGPWTHAYNYIYQANAIIENLNNQNDIDQGIVNQLKGEALFVRAFWYFYLVNIYGDVPLLMTTNYSTNSTSSRTSSSAVYQQIVIDLKNSEALLNSNYVDISDTARSNDRGRPNKSGAEALLSRVYLYKGDYIDAESESSKVIGNSLYGLCSNLNSVFLSNSTEAIWQLDLPVPSPSNSTPDGSGFILVSAPSTSTSNCSCLSQQLLESFSPNDLRLANWVSYFAASSDTFYFPYKYKQYQASSITEYVMVMRLAEQYLIRAEAEAQLGDTASSVSDINVIRERAGLTDTIAGSKESLLATILHERQNELFLEWGHRWFDLIRTNRINSVLGPPGNVCQFKRGTWESTDVLYPIPRSNVSLDVNLVQNPGYQ